MWQIYLGSEVKFLTQIDFFLNTLFLFGIITLFTVHLIKKNSFLGVKSHIKTCPKFDYTSTVLDITKYFFFAFNCRLKKNNDSSSKN